jgi:hypothetical protein
MPSRFDSLGEQLLRGGVGRRHARRYVAELKDHLEDLIAEERREGSRPMEAELRAQTRLGSPEALAAAMIARPELRTWSARAPVVAWSVAPSLALVAGAALTMGAVVAAAKQIGSAEPAVAFSNLILPVLLGWALVALALRRRSAPVWPLVGLLTLAVLGAALQVQVTLPSAGARGEIYLAPSFGALAGWISFIWRLALTLALTLTPYAGLSLRHAQARHGRAQVGS